MLLSCHQNAEQNHDIGRCFENVAQLIYLEMTITNQNLIQEEIRRRLNSGNACYHSVLNRLSSHLLSKNIKIRIYKTIILPMVLCGWETWSLTFREEHRLGVHENRVLQKIYLFRRVMKSWDIGESYIMRKQKISVPKSDEVMGYWRKLHNEELHNLYALPNIIKTVMSRRMRLPGHIAQMGRRGTHIGYWWESQKERAHYEDQDLGVWTILK
jgi:hypothetical protein